MRLVLKSMLHTGYFILDDGTFVPAFTTDLVHEGMLKPFKGKIKKIFGANTESDYNYIRTDIKRFKNAYGIVPQNRVDELRTGFWSNTEHKQTHELFKYK